MSMSNKAFLSQQVLRQAREQHESAWYEYPDPLGFHGVVLFYAGELGFAMEPVDVPHLSAWMQVPIPSRALRLRIASALMYPVDGAVELPQPKTTPEEAFRVLNDMPVNANLHDLSSETGIRLALLYEWMQAFDWEGKRGLKLPPGADPRTFKLAALTERTLEITQLMMSGGGMLTIPALMPRTVAVPGLKLEGNSQELHTLTANVTRIIEKHELLEGRATSRGEANQSMFAGLSNRQLLAELEALTSAEESDRRDGAGV